MVTLWGAGKLSRKGWRDSLLQQDNNPKQMLEDVVDLIGVMWQDLKTAVHKSKKNPINFKLFLHKHEQKRQELDVRRL